MLSVFISYPYIVRVVVNASRREYESLTGTNFINKYKGRVQTLLRNNEWIVD